MQFSLRRRTTVLYPNDVRSVCTSADISFVYPADIYFPQYIPRRYQFSLPCRPPLSTQQIPRFHQFYLPFKHQFSLPHRNQFLPSCPNNFPSTAAIIHLTRRYQFSLYTPLPSGCSSKSVFFYHISNSLFLPLLHQLVFYHFSSSLFSTTSPPVCFLPLLRQFVFYHFSTSLFSTTSHLVCFLPLFIQFVFYQFSSSLFSSTSPPVCFLPFLHQFVFFHRRYRFSL